MEFEELNTEQISTNWTEWGILDEDLKKNETTQVEEEVKTTFSEKDQFFMKKDWSENTLLEKIAKVIGIIFSIPIFLIKKSPQAASWFWNQILVPAVNAIESLVSTLFDRVIYPLCRATKNLASWFWNQILVPAVNAIESLVSTLFDRVIYPLYRATKNLCSWAWHQILVSTANTIESLVSTFINEVIRPSFQALNHYLGLES